MSELMSGDKEGEVLEIINRLEKDVQYQADLVVSLVARLQPVLPDDLVAHDGLEKGGKGKRTPLGKRLDKFHQTIVQTNVFISDTLKRLEI